jgi:hypothetical protein
MIEARYNSDDRERSKQCDLRAAHQDHRGGWICRDAPDSTAARRQGARAAFALDGRSDEHRCQLSEDPATLMLPSTITILDIS